jgi:chemotaxis protein methyltransferase CheR
MPATHSALTHDIHDRFRAHILKQTGISLSQAKTSMIEQRLRRRVVENGFSKIEHYLSALLSGKLGAPEMDMAVDMITTNTTSFFREKQHFDYLSDVLLPKMLAERRTPLPRLKFWSAASSEGAEAFTLAMVLAEAQRHGKRFDWAILGTDLSSRMVAKARKGIYNADQIDQIAPELRQRYTMVSTAPEQAHLARIVPELRAKVQFKQMNLMAPSYPVDHGIDVIFLRNVLIYFRLEDRQKVVEHLMHHIRPGGYLFVGHSEGMSVQCAGLEQIKSTILRKTP